MEVVFAYLSGFDGATVTAFALAFIALHKALKAESRLDGLDNKADEQGFEDTVETLRNRNGHF